MPRAPNFKLSEVRTYAAIGIVAVSSFAFAFVWCQHVSGFSREISFQKLQERLFQRNGAPVLVLGREVCVAENVEQAFAEIEPFNFPSLISFRRSPALRPACRMKRKSSADCLARSIVAG